MMVVMSNLKYGIRRGAECVKSSEYVAMSKHERIMIGVDMDLLSDACKWQSASGTGRVVVIWIWEVASGEHFSENRDVIASVGRKY